jgi:hypothetical protein
MRWTPGKPPEVNPGYGLREVGIVRCPLKSHKNPDRLLLEAKIGTFLSLSVFQVSD